MTDKNLRTKLIRLAHTKPELRGTLLPLLAPQGKRADARSDFVGQLSPEVQKKLKGLGDKEYRTLLQDAANLGSAKPSERKKFEKELAPDIRDKVHGLDDKEYQALLQKALALGGGKAASGRRAAVASVPFKKVPGQDAKVVDLAILKRIQWDWVTDTRDEKYKKFSQQEGFHEYTLPRAEKQFQEANAMIEEATARLRKRVLLFEKSAISELAALGFTLKAGPLVPLYNNKNWADYDFMQKVALHDDVSNWGNPNLSLTWGFRDDVRVSSNWTTTMSDTDGNQTFAQIVITHALREHTDNLAKWGAWVERRIQYMKEKGWYQ